MITVYTYGTYDLLHPGHIRFLNQAAALGDYLMVGVVRDKAVKELKGKDRPVMNEEDRLRIIQSLKSVNFACFQENFDPSDNLRFWKPQILTKGDDWKKIPGTEMIKRLGGKLIKIPYSKGWSTSDTLKKIQCL